MRIQRLLFVLLFILPIAVYSQNKSMDIVDVYNKRLFYSPINIEFPKEQNVNSSFPKGYYYYFRGIIRNDTTYLHEIKNPELIMGFLIGQGIQLEEAWFIGAETRCGIADVMVPSSLTIRVSKGDQSKSLKKFGFFSVEKPISGCSNHGIHYSFSKNLKN